MRIKPGSPADLANQEWYAGYNARSKEVDNQEPKEYLSRFCADWCPKHTGEEEEDE